MLSSYANMVSHIHTSHLQITTKRHAKTQDSSICLHSVSVYVAQRHTQTQAHGQTNKTILQKDQRGKTSLASNKHDERIVSKHYAIKYDICANNATSQSQTIENKRARIFSLFSPSPIDLLTHGSEEVPPHHLTLMEGRCVSLFGKGWISIC